jgi:hypothetical protein
VGDYKRSWSTRCRQTRLISRTRSILARSYRDVRCFLGASRKPRPEIDLCALQSIAERSVSKSFPTKSPRKVIATASWSQKGCSRNRFVDKPSYLPEGFRMTLINSSSLSRKVYLLLRALGYLDRQKPDTKGMLFFESELCKCLGLPPITTTNTTTSRRLALLDQFFQPKKSRAVQKSNPRAKARRICTRGEPPPPKIASDQEVQLPIRKCCNFGGVIC